MSVNLYPDMGNINQHKQWAFDNLHFMSSLLKDDLRKHGIWEDLVQELCTVACDAYLHDMTMKQTRSCGKRRIRAFRKNYGYRPYGKSFIRLEVTASEVFAGFPWQERVIVRPEIDLKPADWFPRDKAFTVQMEESIIRILKRHPEGITGRYIYQELSITAKEAQKHLDRLAKEGRIVRVPRESIYHKWLVYFMSGAAIPEQRGSRTEICQSIWHAYFTEHKSIRCIYRETRHARETIREIIREAPAELAASIV